MNKFTQENMLTRLTSQWINLRKEQLHDLADEAKIGKRMCVDFADGPQETLPTWQSEVR